MEDSQIVALYLERNEQAVQETAAKYGAYCMSIARSILRSEEDAAEIVNEAYLAVWQSIPPNQPETLTAYIGRITRTLCLKRLRMAYAAKRGNGETTAALDELAECIGSGQNVEQEVEAKELALRINCFLQGIPETERSIFVCRYWYFNSISEIAKQFGFSQSKVKSILFRTRKKLCDMLREEDLI